MPAKKKEVLETEFEPETPAIAVAHDWPESTEDRTLLVQLTDDQCIGAGKTLVELLIEEDRLTAEKSAAAKQYGAKLEELQEQIVYRRTVVASGCDRAPVVCRWIFECAGINAETGERNYHPDFKTLIREDTGEVVETMGITSDDRQRNLPLTEAEQMAVGVETLKAAGYEVAELKDDDVYVFGFFRIGHQDEECGLAAESMAEAVQAGLVKLAEIQSAAPEAA